MSDGPREKQLQGDIVSTIMGGRGTLLGREGGAQAHEPGPSIASSYVRAKRLSDVVCSAGALIVTLPLQAAVVALLLITQGRPVIFDQPRPGMHGRVFRLRKFRTMRPEQYPDEPDGDRVTRLGGVLRATSLDELPSLWNILLGDMSFVGPRPLLEEYLTLYSPEEARRHSVRPGLTGLAQVRGRNLVPWPERLALDIKYVDSMSPLTDIRILWSTVELVVNRVGIAQAGHVTMTRFTGSGSKP